jgi:hypothetical protein
MQMNSETKATIVSAGVTAALYFFTTPPVWALVISYGVFWNLVHSYEAKRELESLIIKATM